ncbi:MAG: substrate-binding domain-containing protein [Microbacterium gubbeenense]|uniref:substrate-binding domain-containing protein n=1 Tax=Microbacterium gubbeenense TaxID=159896 RepID=UPI00048AFE88|nr:substrate-binding domain-containing protein [Microbacterium gubbeenense]
MQVHSTWRRPLLMGAAALAAVGLLAGCTSDGSEGEDGGDDTTAEQSTENGTEGGSGDGTVVIGWSGPAISHGWLGSIGQAAEDAAGEFDDVDLRSAEGTDDANAQIAAVEQFINDEVDVIVMLPSDGAALTPVALEAMEAGIPVVNVDREFSDPDAARVTVLGDNYGMGVSAGEHICEQMEGIDDAVIGEIAGIDSLPLTQDRSQGFEDALAECDLDVDARVATDFTVAGGEEQTASLLTANDHFDAIWNHDDDQGIGVLAAINNAGRDEFILVGGAGSKNMMEEISNPDSVVEATIIYPYTQAADGIKLARSLVKGESLTELQSAGVPRRIVLDAPVVTEENVDQYIDQAFES